MKHPSQLLTTHRHTLIKKPLLMQDGKCIDKQQDGLKHG